MNDRHHWVAGPLPLKSANQIVGNVSKVLAGIFSVMLAIWAGKLLEANQIQVLGVGHMSYLAPSIFAGLLAVPVAPIAKDLASSLQTAAAAVTSVKQ